MATYLPERIKLMSITISAKNPAKRVYHKKEAQESLYLFMCSVCYFIYELKRQDVDATVHSKPYS